MTTKLTDRELLDDLGSGPLGQKIARERQERRLAQRKEWAGEIAAVEERERKDLPPLRAVEEAAVAKVRDAEAALAAAREAWGRALTATSSAATQFAGERSHLEGELRRTASTEIDDFIAELSREWESTRRQGVSSSGGGLGWRGEREPVVSNAESVRAHLEGIQAARQAADALALRALDAPALAREIGRIRDGIPAVVAA